MHRLAIRVSALFLVSAFALLVASGSARSQDGKEKPKWKGSTSYGSGSSSGRGSSDTVGRGLVTGKNGKLRPAPGYDWASNDTRSTRVKWSPGLEHDEYRNVFAAPKEGDWRVGPGYEWVNQRDEKDLRVRWAPGIEHRDIRNLIASKTEGDFRPANGYEWSNPDKKGDLRVSKIDMRPAESKAKGSVASSSKESTPAPQKKLETRPVRGRVTFTNGKPAQYVTINLHAPFTEAPEHVTTDGNGSYQAARQETVTKITAYCNTGKPQVINLKSSHFYPLDGTLNFKIKKQ